MGESTHHSQEVIREKRYQSDEVALHYNNRPEVGTKRRKESEIFFLKSYNNWIKSILINKYVKPGSSVLDLGCGKGGDLLKYSKAKIKTYFGMDIADISIEQAKERFSTMSFANFSADFKACDCFGENVSSYIPEKFMADAVSLQFCMHYAFDEEKNVRTMLKNATHRLNKGGILFATIPNAYWIVKKLKASKDLSFGNSIYNIRFEQKDEFPVYGHKYWFGLEDAIDGCPEFLVHFPTFERIAAEYDLRLKFKMGFHEMFEEFSKVPQFNDLLYKMNVFPENPDSDSINDQWEAIGIYLAFAFEKQ